MIVETIKSVHTSKKHLTEMFVVISNRYMSVRFGRHGKIRISNFSEMTERDHNTLKVYYDCIYYKKDRIQQEET